METFDITYFLRSDNYKEKHYEILLRMKKRAKEYSIERLPDILLDQSDKGLIHFPDLLDTYDKYEKKYLGTKYFPLFMYSIIHTIATNGTTIRIVIKKERVEFYHDSRKGYVTLLMALLKDFGKDLVGTYSGAPWTHIITLARDDKLGEFLLKLNEINTDVEPIFRIVDSRMRINKYFLNVKARYPLRKSMREFLKKHYPDMVVKTNGILYSKIKEDILRMWDYGDSNPFPFLNDLDGNDVCEKCKYVSRCIYGKMDLCPYYEKFKPDAEFLGKYIKYFYLNKGGE